METKKLLLLLLFVANQMMSQVGIGTTSPRGAVDISSTTQGLVLPKVSLTSTYIQTALNPQGGIIPAGTLVYNDMSSGSGLTAVSPGMYYWDGVKWVSVLDISEDWSLNGNSGTDASTNFLGTTDAKALTLRTNDFERFRIPNANQVHALSRGDINLPFYSWGEDSDTGIWLRQNDELVFSAGKLEFLRFRERGQDETVFNIDGRDIDFRIETDDDADTFFVDGNTNSVGISTKNIDPTAILEVKSTTQGVLFPRLTEVQMEHISTTNTTPGGLTVFCTDCCSNSPGGALFCFNGIEWKSLDGDCSYGFPSCIPIDVTFPASDHLGPGIIPNYWDGDTTQNTQANEWGMRFHHDNKDIVKFGLNTPIPVGGKIVLYWSDFYDVGDEGLVIDLDLAGALAQTTVDTYNSIYPNSVNTVNPIQANNYILTIDVISEIDTITIRATNDERDGPHPSLYEFTLLDQNGNVIPLCN